MEWELQETTEVACSNNYLDLGKNLLGFHWITKSICLYHLQVIYTLINDFTNNW